MHINWANYLFHANFTSERDTLVAIQPGVVSDDTALMLAAVLAEVDTGEGKELWSDNPDAGIWSTAGATVIYNGRNSHSMPTKYKMKYVLTLELPQVPAGQQNRIYLQYNDAPEIPVADPVDPSTSGEAEQQANN
jgi:hypothetical protein